MREILFRGKRLDNGELVEGSLVIANDRINNGKCYILPCLSDFSCGDRGNRIRVGNFVEVYPDTVGQYAGFCDDNGKKIFEGDIVLDRWNKPKAVLFCTEDVASCGCCYPLFEGSGFKAENTLLPYTCVIGNIHDNPELLKGMEHG